MQEDTVTLPYRSEWSEYDIQQVKKEFKLLLSWEEMNNIKKTKVNIVSPNKK